MTIVLDGAIAGWLRRLGVLRDAELSPYGESVALSREAAAEFENGLRVGRLLQVLPGAGAGSKLNALKDLNTPVAKLYNWNQLLPSLRERGVQVDADMKVLIVAGDTDIVLDVLQQLHAAASVEGGGKAARERGDPRRADYFGDGAAAALEKPSDARTVQEFFALCLHHQLKCSWQEAQEIIRSSGLRKLSAKLMHGVQGDFGPLVRYLKLAFAHCRHLVALCERDGSACELALAVLRDGLCSLNADVVLWTSRLLCRLAAELGQRGEQAALWPWFSRPAGGFSALVEAMRAHPELHAAGALLPIVLHFSGDNLSQFLTVVCPQSLAEPAPFLTLVLELLPLLSATKGMSGYMAKSGALEYLLQRALHVARQQYAPPTTRGHALDLLAALWSGFAGELQAIPLEPLPGEAQSPPRAGGEDADGTLVRKQRAVCSYIERCRYVYV